MSERRITYDAEGSAYEVGPRGWRPLQVPSTPESPLQGVAAFEPHPMNWDQLQRDGLPQIEYLREPYLPAGARIWAWGPAESGKSLWSLCEAAALTREGHTVAYVSQENPLAEEVRRLERVRPEWSRLRFFHDQEFNLLLPDHVAALVEAASGAKLVVVDTLSACWGGDEGDNDAIAAFDRQVLIPLVRATGASVLVLDHTGHPQPFVRRRGVSAGRGASSKGQKADGTLEFRPGDGAEFVIEHGKNRMGGQKQPPRRFRFVDTEDGAIEVEELTGTGDSKARDLADSMVEAIQGAGWLTTKGLREVVKGRGGQRLQEEAMELLRLEDPPRVHAAWEIVETEGGRQRAKVWRSATQGCPEGIPGVSQDTLERGKVGYPGVGVWDTPDTPDTPLVTEAEAVARLRRELDAEALSPAEAAALGALP